MTHVSPSLYAKGFNCLYCGAFAHQDWYKGCGRQFMPDETLAGKTAWSQDPPKIGDNVSYASLINNFMFSVCSSCEKVTAWFSNNVAHPLTGGAPPANGDMPPDVRRDYDEASTILSMSPRGAAALLRLAIQKLCKDLGQKGKNIDDDIGALVAAGLNPMIQRALDTVRVIGNESVHPGQIDLRDDRGTAESLFRLVNMIVEKTISEPKQVDALYALLPEGKRLAIEKRDSKQP